MLASFPSFIADVLANVLRYRHDDVPVLVANLHDKALWQCRVLNK
jgi:hypothetical protein